MARALIMTDLQNMARFVANTGPRDVRPEAADELKVRLLHALGAAIAAQQEPDMAGLLAMAMEPDVAHAATLIGGGRTGVGPAIVYNGALFERLDATDRFVTDKADISPAVHMACMLAVGESIGARGLTFITASAMAYQVHVRLVQDAPPGVHGFSTATAATVASAAGCACLMDLDEERTAHAIAIAASSGAVLRVADSEKGTWRRLVNADACNRGYMAARYAAAGVTASASVFEGEGGYQAVVSGSFDSDWATETFDAAHRSAARPYWADAYLQSTMEAATKVRTKERFSAVDIESVTLHSAEERILSHANDADLATRLACVLLDGGLPASPRTVARLAADDVQKLAGLVRVVADDRLIPKFADQIPASVTVQLRDGTLLEARVDDAKGSRVRPLSFDEAFAAFDTLVEPFAEPLLRKEIGSIIHDLEHQSAARLAEALGRVSREPRD